MYIFLSFSSEMIQNNVFTQIIMFTFYVFYNGGLSWTDFRKANQSRIFTIFTQLIGWKIWVANQNH